MTGVYGWSSGVTTKDIAASVGSTKFDVAHDGLRSGGRFVSIRTKDGGGDLIISAYYHGEKLHTATAVGQGHGETKATADPGKWAVGVDWRNSFDNKTFYDVYEPDNGKWLSDMADWVTILAFLRTLFQLL
jgi:hypothetical protein